MAGAVIPAGIRSPWRALQWSTGNPAGAVIDRCGRCSRTRSHHPLLCRRHQSRTWRRDSRSPRPLVCPCHYSFGAHTGRHRQSLRQGSGRRFAPRRSRSVLIAAIKDADATVRQLETAPRIYDDASRDERIALATRLRRYAVIEAVLRRPIPVSWAEVADALHLSVDDVRSRYIH